MEKIKGVTYEELAKREDMPKSRGELVSKILKSAAASFSKGIGKKLLILAIVAIGIALINILAYTFSTYDSFSNSFFAYLFNIPDAGYYGIKGFNGSNAANTTSMIVSLDFVLIFGIVEIITRYKKVGMKLIKDVPNAFKVKRAAKAISYRDEKKAMFAGFIVAFIVGLIIKNPFTIVLAAIFVLAEVGKGRESSLFINIFMWRVTGNMSKKKKETVLDMDVILDMFWFAIGLVLYIPLVMAVWNVFSYKTTARVVLSIGFAVLFWFLGYGNVSKKQKVVANVLFCFFIATAFVILVDTKAFAGFDISNTDGWGSRKGSPVALSEYKDKADEASEPSGWRAAFAALSLAATQTLNQIKSFFTHGTGDFLSGIFGVSQADGNLEQGMAAYNAAMSSIPGLGDAVGGAASGIDSAMNGEE